jgi:biopolymer transport protein ExbB
MPFSLLPAPVAELVAAGGFVLVVLILLSVFTLAVIIAKAWQFASLRLGDRSFVEAGLQALAAGDPEAARAALGDRRNPLAGLMLASVEGDARLQPAEREALLERRAQLDLATLGRQIRSLELIANIAPLLGLLGTVLGMIEAFEVLRAAESRVDPALLAGGISKALITTAAGLMIAIPASAAASWFEGRIERFRVDMEDVLGRALLLGRVGVHAH